MSSATLTFTPQHAKAPAGTARWVEVVSHLDPKYGGLSAAVPALARHLCGEARLRTEIAAFCAPEERFAPEGLSTRQLTYWPASRRPWLPTVRGASPLAREFTAHLRTAAGLHIHGLWETSTAAAAASAHSLGIPYILSAHGMLEPWALQQRRLKKLVYSALIERGNVRRAAALHALTAAEAQQYIRFGARSPIAVIPNGVEVPARLDRSEFLERFPALIGKRVVLFLGRLHTKKGLDLLLDAWRSIAPLHPEAALVLAGPDAEGTQARLASFVAAHGLGHSVHFTGMLRGSLKWSALAAAECFVLPSHSEGLSVSILEAMGTGTPVLVTEPCNMPEVREHATGWLIPVSLPALTAALQELLTNPPSLNAQIGARGAHLVQQQFTWPNVAAKMAELYRFVLGGPEPQTVPLIHP